MIKPLIDELAEVGSTWTNERREGWKATFSAVFDYAYPAKDDESTDKE